MRAAVVKNFSDPIVVEEYPDPKLHSGCVIVRVLAAFVPSPMLEFTRGQVPFSLPSPPYVPGTDAIGVIDSIADDVHGLEIGQKVYCDDYVTLKGRSVVGAYVGLGGMMPGADAVLSAWPNGCFAEKFMLPCECVTPLDSAESVPPSLLSRIGYIGTSYGAIQRGNFRPGQRTIVNGATGILGVGTVLLLLAMGAGRVVALGRKGHILEQLETLDPQRVVGLRIEKEPLDANEIVKANHGPADLFIDTIGFTDNPSLTSAGIKALGLNGFAVLIGGVNADIPIAYATQMIGLKLTVRGSEWFPASATTELLRMAGSGVIDFSSLSVRSFNLEDTQQALEYANSGPGAFEHVAIIPTK